MTTRIVELENCAWTEVGNLSASVEKVGSLTSVWLATGTAPPAAERAGHFLRSGKILTVELSEGESLYAYGQAVAGAVGSIKIVVTE